MRASNCGECDAPAWLARKGPNVFYRHRLSFTRRWLRDPNAVHNDMLLFECYPWHSSGVTAPMRPPPEVIDEFVWQPISEIDVEHVFAFGRPWDQLLAAELKFRRVLTLGLGGRDYGSRVPGRAIRVYELPSMQRLVIEWHPGAAGPPAAAEVELLRVALGN